MGRKSWLAVVVLFCVLLGLTSVVVRAFANGQAASVVLGQPDFVTNSGVTTQTGTNSPGGVAFDLSGNLWVADAANNRVLEFVKGAGFTNGQAASVVLGQPDFVTRGPATTADGMNSPTGVAFDLSGNLWVADAANNRVLEFVPPFQDGQAASVVLGQPDFVSSGTATTATGMDIPHSVATDLSGNVWVADDYHDRVLEFVKGAGFTNGQAASVVLGQPDFVTNDGGTTQTSMNEPSGVAVDPSGNVWVSCYYDRVLEFVKGAGFTNGQAASVVLGQPDFVSEGEATSATGMRGPESVAIDKSGNVWVADYVNSRVLEFTPPFTNGQAASVVLGQPGFTSEGKVTTATGMNYPLGVATDSAGNVWVADTVNNRVLEFQIPASTTSVSCDPASLSVGSTSSCTATVTGSSPTGTVTWSSSSGTPSFSAGTCQLSSGSCQVTYSDTAPGAPVITASYEGDSNNPASSGSYILANFNPEATEAESTSTSISGGGIASADQQSTTGINVSISGAQTNTAATIFSADLPSLPPGTETLSVTGLGFYDVRISGITSGTASVCISNTGVTSSTLLQYYLDGSWQSATGVVDTPGVSLCGNIPVSALNGTLVVPGNASSSTTSSTTTSTTTTTTTAATSSSSTSSTSSSTSTSSSSSSSGGEGIPEFPFQLGLATLVTFVVVAAYVVTRRSASRR